MTIDLKRRRFINEVPWGVYLWKMPNGSYLADGEGHFLMINSTYKNAERIQAMRDAVKSYGIEEGDVEFFPGHRAVTDEEYEEQRLRMVMGLTPDVLDVASIESDRDVARRG